MHNCIFTIICNYTDISKNKKIYTCSHFYKAHMKKQISIYVHALKRYKHTCTHTNTHVQVCNTYTHTHTNKESKYQTLHLQNLTLRSSVVSGASKLKKVNK